MNRRLILRAVTICLGLLLVTVAPSALAGSYLSRSAILLKGAEIEAKALRARFRDKELVQIIHRLAKVRVEAAGTMQVPKEVMRAHPHLLLALSSYEMAAEAALRGEQEGLLVALSRARQEVRIFEAVLKRSGWVLPSL